MKRDRSKFLLHTLPAAGLGFTISFLLCLFINHRIRDSQATVEETTIASDSGVRASEPAPAANFAEVLSQIHDDGIKGSGLLERTSQFGALDAASRRSLLEKVLELPEEDRSEILAIVLSQWATCDPGGAAGWCQENLIGFERGALLKDVVMTWQQSDARALLKFWAERMPEEELVNFGMGVALRGISDHDPIAVAEFLDMPQLRDLFRLFNLFQAEHLQDPVELARCSEAVTGKIGYSLAAEEEVSRAQPLSGKSGWNDLFEQVAIERHRLDPDACREWLGGFPELAQRVARHKIEDAERSAEIATKSKLARNAPEPVHEPAFDRRDPQTVPQPESFADVQREWAEWWRQDQAAAEAFIGTSAWPEQLIFQARAQAYAGPPAAP